MDAHDQMDWESCVSWFSSAPVPLDGDFWAGYGVECMHGFSQVTARRMARMKGEEDEGVIAESDAVRRLPRRYRREW